MQSRFIFSIVCN